MTAGLSPETYWLAAITESVLVGETRNMSGISRLPAGSAGSRFMELPVTVDPMTGMCSWAETVAAAMRVCSVLWPRPTTAEMCSASACFLMLSTASFQDAYWLPMLVRYSLTPGLLPYAAVLLARQAAVMAPSMLWYSDS